MIDLSVFGLGVIALLSVWKFVLRPSIEDTFKDLLFDVRDSLRKHFVEVGQLDTPAYQALRDTMNGYIRFVEVANLTETHQFAVMLSQQPKVAERYFRQLDRRFEVKDENLAKIAKASRKRCSRIIQIYLFHSSLVAVSTIYLVMVPLAVGYELVRFCLKHAKQSWRSVWVSANAYIQGIGNRFVTPQLTELFSQMSSFGGEEPECT